MKEQYRTQVAVTRFGSRFAVELRIKKPDGTFHELLRCGDYPDEETAVRRAGEVQDKIFSAGGKPTAGTS